jgi:hypothetical protein
VNALVSQLLSDKGYIVDQYTSLDGYSTDWPTGGDLLGDIRIANIATADMKENYRVTDGLEKYVIRQLRQASSIAPITLAVLESFPILTFVPAAAAFGMISTQDVQNVFEIMKLMRSGSYRPRYEKLLTDANDLRAPIRAGFSNVPIPTYLGANSDHLNITDAYFSNKKYLNSYLGQKKGVGIG